MSKRRDLPKYRIKSEPASVRPTVKITQWFSSFWVGGGLAVGVPFFFYVRNLAPSVTFEDSGELIAAAHGWGIPHAPGYPLYTILAKFFTLLPLGDNIAYRVNLMSAVFSALAIGFLYLVILKFLEHDANTASIQTTNVSNSVVHTFAAFGAIAVAVSPAYFSQSVITEVYGLNNFFFGMLLWILLSWIGDSREHWFGMLCFGFGLSLTNHHTAVLFGPLILLIWTIKESKIFIHWKGVVLARKAVTGVILFSLGLLPYLYLPLASLRQPVIDWGNPETPWRFWDLVSRGQYGLDWAAERSVALYLAQLGLQVELLFEQFHPLLVFLGLWGVVHVWRRSWAHRSLLIGYLLFTGPVMAFVTDADLLTTDPMILIEEKSAVSVWYLPLFLMWGALIAVGTVRIVAGLARRAARPTVAWLCAVPLLVLIFFSGARTQAMEGQSQAVFAGQYVENIFTLAEPRALVLGNWDPFVFPLMYAQAVEHKRQDVVVLDTQLLRLSWYIEMMQRWYPDFMARAAPEIDGFLEAVQPLEEGTSYAPELIQATFVRMLKALIAIGHADGSVYVAFHPRMRNFEPVLAEDFDLESCLVAFKLKRKGTGSSDCDRRSYNLTGMIETQNSRIFPMDRMAKMVRSYYALLHRVRATSEQERAPRRAAELYRRALGLEADPAIRNQLRIQVERLENIVGQ